MPTQQDFDYFPIRILSQKTGVGSSTLRAWERRYGLLKPARTPKGHRLYQLSDVLRIERICQWLADGYGLSDISKKLSENSEYPSDDKSSPDSPWQHYRESCLLAIGDFSNTRLQSIHQEALSLYPLVMSYTQLILPVTTVLSERARSSPDGLAQEAFYINWVRNSLTEKFVNAQEQATGNRLLLVDFSGPENLELLIIGLAVMARGYQVVNLGYQSSSELVAVASEHAKVRGIVIVGQASADSTTYRQLLKRTIAGSIPVMAIGDSSELENPEFDSAGGIRLGADVTIAVQLLSRHVEPGQRSLHQHTLNNGES